jgi:hypothetical protein
LSNRCTSSQSIGYALTSTPFQNATRPSISRAAALASG